MLLFKNLLEYERSSPWPERASINIQLKPDLSLTVRCPWLQYAILSTDRFASQLHVPNFGVVANVDDGSNTKSPLARVVLAHAAFKAMMQPDIAPDDGFYKTCIGEANVISLFFPDIKVDGIRIAFTAWLAFACVMDDILETLDIADRELVLVETIEILRCGE